MKTLREILTEKDDEFEYVLKSTADIHTPEMISMIKMALGGFKIRDIEVDSYKPISKDNGEFPNEPNAAVFSLKIVTGFPALKGEDLIAMFTRIHVSHLKLVPTKKPADLKEPDEYKPITTNDFHDATPDNKKEDVQDTVGGLRIADFMRELKGARKEREENKREREVYESFVTSHIALEHDLRRPFRKGFYIAEMTGKGSEIVLSLDGPFQYKPDNFLMRDQLPISEGREIGRTRVNGSARVVTEFKITGYEIPRITEDQGGMTYFEVEVQDTDTGRKFSVVIKEMSSAGAREKAIQTVAAQHQLDPQQLVAVEPSPVGV